MLLSSSFVSAAFMILSSVTALPHGHYQPRGPLLLDFQQRVIHFPGANSTSGIATVPSYYQNAKGADSIIRCPVGTRYQPYSAQAFCHGAPKGRFQSMPGQATVCGTCCGWAAPFEYSNVSPVNCTGATPNAWPSSGGGCIGDATACVRAKTCAREILEWDMP
ncbi:hypothetical protein B0H15DRAFT_368759 [Mycena belliarum]|uniref:Uncharacterized protein n=1 Tax=Mycena belliarum TaxID=1033014 RepID=A0AAD6U1K8_9AGAR|nr:hypothetical protein B0H15DRAFT_368759 [Mycena belliae]